jgi:hypothetical protein
MGNWYREASNAQTMWVLAETGGFNPGTDGSLDPSLRDQAGRRRFGPGQLLAVRRTADATASGDPIWEVASLADAIEGIDMRVRLNQSYMRENVSSLRGSDGQPITAKYAGDLATKVGLASRKFTPAPPEKMDVLLRHVGDFTDLAAHPAQVDRAALRAEVMRLAADQAGSLAGYLHWAWDNAANAPGGGGDVIPTVRRAIGKLIDDAIPGAKEIGRNVRLQQVSRKVEQLKARGIHAELCLRCMGGGCPTCGKRGFLIPQSQEFRVR